MIFKLSGCKLRNCANLVILIDLQVTLFAFFVIEFCFCHIQTGCLNKSKINGKSSKARKEILTKFA